MQRRFLVPLVLTAAAALAAFGVVHAQEAAQIAEKLAVLRDAAADRDPDAAERAFAAFDAAQPGQDTRDEGAILLAKTRLLAGRAAEAAEAVRGVVARTESPWHVKALYVTAEAAARRRGWGEAADIYARRVEFASSDLHKGEIAALHREIADAAFDGWIVKDELGRETRAKDWAVAAEFYGNVVARHVDEKDRALVWNRWAKSRFESGDVAGAESTWRALLEKGAGTFTADTLYGIGSCELRTGRNPEARATFERLRKDHLDSPLAAPALRRIGEAFAAEGGSSDATDRAVAAWREFLRLHPQHEEAPDVAWQVAMRLQNHGRTREAADAFRDVVARFPDHKMSPDAQMAVAGLHSDLHEFDRAISEYQALLARWPNHSNWQSARDGIVGAAFAKGEVAFAEDRRADAKAAYEAFLSAHENDARCADARHRLGELAAKDGAHAAAVEAWRLCATKHEKRPAAPRSVLRIAEAYEGPLADLDKALAAWEELVAKWPGSGEAQRARDVLVQMKGKNLELRVARPFRTDEAPAASLRVRNVPRLRMKAYKVRLDEYVRRKGGFEGVGDVVVDVVKPDHEWDFDVPEYGKYRMLDRSLPLPFKAPGAWIVTAADDELTATFLAVVSDLGVIVKSASNQSLVFVWDERTGQPVEGARVALLSGGEGVTGADGVWRKDDAASASQVIVTGRGAHDGHGAFGSASAAGATAFGYTTKTYLWSDRPVYRPGQTVRLRAIVRREHGGRYVTEAKLPVHLRVIDPRGATLLEQPFETDEFGFISHDLALAPEPSLGEYTVQALLDGRAETQGFEVLAYKKPEILAEAVPEKGTYLSGDTVKATVSLRYAVGGVVSGAPVKWTLMRGPFAFDASVHEAFAWFFRDAARDAERARRAEEGQEMIARGDGATDASGKLEVSFPTAAVERDHTYVLLVEATDPNRQVVRTSMSVPVTTRGVHVLVRTERKVIRPGEALKAELTTVDPQHVPVAMAGKVRLIRRRLEAQRYVEDVVSEADAATDAAGRAVAEVKAAKAGDHVIRFVGKDARGREVSGETIVTVAGDAEDLAKQARLVADREFYKEGDVAKVFVNVPNAPAPVLLTWEGERVLEHRVFVASERANTIEMPLKAEHAPNVFLRMASARGGSLHEDGDEVAVFQYLDVKVEADPQETKPGGKVRLTVTTTDQSGRPVRAQTGVDVVDAAILQIRPDRSGQVKPFFYDQRRTHGVRTGGGAALPALTRPTNKDLLFEQMRRLGKEKFREMQEAVRLGREALERGENDRAVQELRKALEIAPGNYEARSLLGKLEEAKEVEKSRMKRESAAPAKKPMAPPAGSPASQPARPGDDAADHNESADDAAVGVGGGGGGSGGRFGARRGGSAPKSKDAKNSDKGGLKADSDGYAEDERQGDMPADAREPGDPPMPAETVALLDSLSAGGVDSARMLQLAAESPVFVPADLRRLFADTAWSSPSVRTDDQGRATVEIDLPDNLTEWKVTARGASAGPLVGEGATRFRTRKNVLVRPDTPRFLVQGDTTTPTGTVHMNLDAEQEVLVRFTPTALEGTGEAERRLRMAPGQVRALDGGLLAKDHGLGRLKIEALTPVESDAAEVGLPVLPFGLRRIDGASGMLVEEAFAELSLPESSVAGTTSVTVTISPSVDLSLLESLAFTGGYPWGCVEQTVNRFLPALAAREALRGSGSWAERLGASLDETVRRGLAALYSMQQDDGSFSWFGVRGFGVEGRVASGSAQPQMTAYAVLGFARAEQAGFAVSVWNRDRAVAAAKNLLRGASAEDRAFLLYALSFAGQAEIEPLNALFRERATLSPRATALLALTMQRTGRPGNALELVRSLESKAARSDGLASWSARDAKREDPRRIPVAADAEPTAYALLAFLVCDPQSIFVDDAAAWLIRSRRGPAWKSTRDTAAAVEALASWARLKGVARAAGDVEVFVNGEHAPSARIAFGGAGKPVDAPVTTELDAAKFRAGKNRIVLRRSGAGRVVWSAMASAVEAPGKDGIAAGGTVLRVARSYSEHLPRPLPGEKVEERIAAGWSVVVPAKRPARWDGRPLAAAATGDKIKVTLRVSTTDRADFVLVEDMLPAGFEVVSGSAEGPFDREERRDDRQAFFLSRLDGETTLSYVLQAIHPGAYRALPAAVRCMYEPELNAWTVPASLRVEADASKVRRAPTPDEITPDEVWGLAMRDLRAKSWTTARAAIEGLMQQYELRPEVLEEAWAALFRIGVETKDAQLLVKAHEQLSDRNPRRVSKSVEDRRRLADAYRSLDEHERALVLYRDLVRDLSADGFASAQAFARVGDPWRARSLALAALLRLPDVSWTDELAMAQCRGTLAMRAPLPAGKGMRPVTSAAQPLMLDEGVRMLRAFQSHRAASPLAHEAGHLCVQTLLRMGLEKDAVAEGGTFLRRHAESHYADDVTLLVAQGHFQAGDYDAALAASKSLLDGRFPVQNDPKRREPSEFRTQAIHLAAKVAHLRGQFPQAIDLYRQVAGLFPDAADALAFLTREGLELREVETALPGESARILVRRRNVAEARFDVYAVDFMILYAVRRNLSAMNRIDLSGIEPVQRVTAAGRGNPSQWTEDFVEVPVKDRGVYLVVGRAGGHEASSVLLVSDLELSVQESGGRLRVYATDRRTGKSVPEVYVKVGDGSTIRAQGFTDARGVLDVPAVEGSFSVVAEKDGNVALWRR
ncbi:MAG: Outer membrane protein assembly factor BamD [Planctomycetes bacterium]|nr:Outer membrane protein assembly factor BamD [Planctomycetota bacterium]